MKSHENINPPRRSAFVMLALLFAGCATPAEPSPQPVLAPPPAVSARTEVKADDAGAGADANVNTVEEPFVSNEKFSLLIRGGDVIDGSGKPRARADVLVQGESIVHVGRVDPKVQATRVVDATGSVVTPGFIDAHAHADPRGSNENVIAMGVTTVCVGQDGRSPSNERLRDWAASVERERPVVNVAPFVGHGTVRNRAGVGLSDRPAPKGIAAMSRLVAEAMEDGAFGLSTGLEYQPGRSAKVGELVEIAKPVAAKDGVVMSHMRSEDDDAIDGALDELIAMGAGSGARVHVAHIKVVYGHGAPRAERLLERLNAARAQKVSITADIYPYNASYTGIDIVFPDWAKPPNAYAKVVSKRRAELGEYLRKRVALRNGPEATLFGTGRYAGKTLARVAADQRIPFEDVLIEMGPSGAEAAYFVMDDALQSRLLTDPHVMIGSDGSAGSRHPRGYGTFAKVIREYAMTRKALTLEETIRKMTGLTAATLRLNKRGLVQAGFAADLVIFDPSAVKDTATFERPNRLAEGFSWVFVNGQPVRESGAFVGTRTRPGHVLRMR